MSRLGYPVGPSPVDVTGVVLTSRYALIRHSGRWRDDELMFASVFVLVCNSAKYSQMFLLNSLSLVLPVQAVHSSPALWWRNRATRWWIPSVPVKLTGSPSVSGSGSALSAMETPWPSTTPRRRRNGLRTMKMMSD